MLGEAIERLGARARAIIACGVIAIGALWLALQWGPAQEGYFDSAFYLDGARHLAAGEGFVSASVPPDRQDYAPVTRWAPGFPSLIAAVMRFTGAAPLAAAGIVLGSAYLVSVLMVFLLAFELLEGWAVAGGILLAALFASQPDCLRALDALLSDLPFAALALSSTFLAVRAARRPRMAWLEIGLLGCCLAAMVLVRYAAALFVPGLILALGAAMLLRRRALWDVVRTSALPCILVIAVLALWIARNRQFGPDAFGERVPSNSDVVQEFEHALTGAFSWWIALRDFAHRLGLRWWVHAGSLLMAAACLALLFSGLTRAREALLFTVVPWLGYFASMIFAASRVRFDSIDQSRFWIPLWPLTFLAVLALVATSRQRWSRICSGLVLALLAAVLVGQLRIVTRDLPSAQEPRGLLIERWQRAAAVLPDPNTCRLFVTDVRPFMLHRVLGPTSEIPLTVPELESAARRHGSVCIATVSRRLRVSSSAERRRVDQTQVVAALQAQNRLQTIVTRDGVTVMRWIGASGPPLEE